jgi:hypothetical protein
VNKFFAQIISTVLNPVVILAVLPFIFVLKSTQSFSTAVFWTIFSLVFLLIFCVFILLGIEEKYFSNLDVSNKKQRPLLYAFSIGLASFYLLFLYFLKAPQVLSIALFGLIVGLVLMDLINRITKASVHVAAVSAFATSLTLGINFLLVASFLLVPLMAMARIKTHNHTKRQTLIGAFMGILITLSVYVIFKYIV